MTSVGLGRAPHISTCKQTAQVLNSVAATPSSIPGLSFVVLSGRRYIFEFFLVYQTAATTTGLGLVFTAPAMTSASWFVQIRQGSAGTDLFHEAGAAALTTQLTSASVASANADVGAWVKGICQPSADGTIQLQAVTEVDASQITVQNVGVGVLIDAG